MKAAFSYKCLIFRRYSQELGMSDVAIVACAVAIKRL